MTASAELIPPAELPMPARRHRWENEQRMKSRTERTCSFCQLVKITEHPVGRYPYRAWRHPESGAEFVCEHTPPCQGEVKP